MWEENNSLSQHPPSPPGTEQVRAAESVYKSSSNFNVYTSYPGTSLKADLRQQVWSEFLTSSLVMSMMLVHGPHSEKQGARRSRYQEFQVKSQRMMTMVWQFSRWSRPRKASHSPHTDGERFHTSDVEPWF